MVRSCSGDSLRSKDNRCRVLRDGIAVPPQSLQQRFPYHGSKTIAGGHRQREVIAMSLPNRLNAPETIAPRQLRHDRPCRSLACLPRSPVRRNETPIRPSLIVRVPFGASFPAFDAVEARPECETLPQSRLSQAWIVCVDRVNLAAACDQLEPIIFEYLLDDPAFLDQVTVGIA
jgi:hypothetical protein